MPCRDSERVKSQCHISDLRRSAAEGERDPAGGTAVTQRVCQSKRPRKMWLSVSVHPPERFYKPTTTTTISQQHLFFSNSYWTFALQRVFFFLKKEKNNKQTKKKQNVSTQDTKTPNCFCKIWTAWYSPPPCSRLNLTNQEEKKYQFCF